jgi:rhodanese-related sulfurtransferase
VSLRATLSRLFSSQTRPSRITVDQARALQASGALLLDVRSREEYRAGHAPGARNIPVDRLAERLRELPSSKQVLTICQSGGRSARAAATLAGHGLHDVCDVRGGMSAWQRAGLPVERRR